MERVLRYINPLARLGQKNYSFLFPLAVSLLIYGLSEIFVFGVVQDPSAVGSYIIFVSAALVIYSAFRDGIKGGIASTALTVSYYFYIIYTRNYTGEQFTSGVATTLMLGAVFLLVSVIIGWLKQRIDGLIEHEADEKRRLEAIIQQLPVGILITDSNGVLTQRNKKLDSILGVKLPIGFRVGQDTLVKEKIDDKAIDPSQSPLYNALKSKKPVIGKEFTFERRDGKKLSLQVNSAPILNSKKEIVAAASIISDITRQKDLERQKDDFLGVASHELKTPVTSIKAYGLALQNRFKKQGDTKAVDQLKKMDNQINKLTKLIGDLLDVTKIQSGKIEFYRNEFELNELTREVIDELQIISTTHKIIFHPSRKALVYADRERIGQVLTNLITNAIKYSPDSKEIVVAAAVTKESITLSVKDFGVGIPIENQEKVFERFFRVNGPRQSTFPGLGLGLYISSEIIKRENGKIWAKSAPGKGSTFSFTLPLVQTLPNK